MRSIPDVSGENLFQKIPRTKSRHCGLKLHDSQKDGYTTQAARHPCCISFQKIRQEDPGPQLQHSSRLAEDGPTTDSFDPILHIHILLQRNFTVVNVTGYAFLC